MTEDMFKKAGVLKCVLFGCVFLRAAFRFCWNMILLDCQKYNTISSPTLQRSLCSSQDSANLRQTPHFPSFSDLPSFDMRGPNCTVWKSLPAPWLILRSFSSLKWKVSSRVLRGYRGKRKAFKWGAGWTLGGPWASANGGGSFRMWDSHERGERKV